MTKPLGQVRSSFGGALGFVGWLATLTAPFLFRPPFLRPDDRGLWPAAAHFLGGVVVLLLLGALTARATRRQLLFASLGLLVSCGAIIVLYSDLRERWTVAYAGESTIIGETYTPRAAEYARELEQQTGHPPSAVEMLRNSGSAADEVWIPEERRARWRSLGGLYVAATALLASLVVAITRFAKHGS